jgi:hypothetical protein
MVSVHPNEEKGSTLDGESRGRLFGLVRLDLWLQISPFASVQELVTS